MVKLGAVTAVGMLALVLGTGVANAAGALPPSKPTVEGNLVVEVRRGGGGGGGGFRAGGGGGGRAFSGGGGFRASGGGGFRSVAPGGFRVAPGARHGYRHVHRYRRGGRVIIAPAIGFGSYGYYGYGYGYGCGWLLDRAQATGLPYWWQRYHACRAGY